jgi:hypothetical protein
MKNKLVFMIWTMAFIVSLIGCNKTAANSQPKEQEKPLLMVEAVKVTNDIDSTFKVQAVMEGDAWGSGNSDLGIVGAIEDGKLTISIVEPTEEMLWDPLENDLGCETDGMKISQLHISTAKASIVLDQPRAGGNIAIWYANKDGVVDFLGDNGKVSLKSGWNFIEVFQRSPVPNANVWTSLQDVYEKGHYKWILADSE